VPTRDDEARIEVTSDADVVAARQSGRRLAELAGFSTTDQTLIATAISEIARNILLYAQRGEIVISTPNEVARHGITVVASDSGPGIPDIELAMEDGYTTGQGSGLGLPGSRRLMDEFEISSEIGKGTIVTMRKWRR
jgi:serine/threonine-protein kinase RsbT